MHDVGVELVEHLVIQDRLRNPAVQHCKRRRAGTRGAVPAEEDEQDVAVPFAAARINLLAQLADGPPKLAQRRWARDCGEVREHGFSVAIQGDEQMAVIDEPADQIEESRRVVVGETEFPR